MTYFPDHGSSDEVAATKRLTSRDVASAWGLALFGLVGLAGFSVGSLAFGSAGCACAVDATFAVGEQQQTVCRRTVMDIPRPRCDLP